MTETWRTIDTAPIGRVVLLYVRGVGIVEGSRGKRSGWWTGWECSYMPLGQEDVTHWAPVPRWPE
ncbi:MAG: hypothetical protein KBA95_15810 [Acidobacteria bacterium]|nr:hypothetical protein [Acidobacteriota bacterium]